MSLNSKIVFSKKAADYGLQSPALNALVEKGWDAMGKFAFACSAMPG